MDDVDVGGPDCGPMVEHGAQIGGAAGLAVGGAAGIAAAIEEGPGATVAGAATIVGVAELGRELGQGAGAVVGFGACEAAYEVENGVQAIGDWYHNMMAPVPQETAPAPASPTHNPDMASSGSSIGSWGGFHSAFDTQVAWGGTDQGFGGFSGHDSSSSHDHGGGGGASHHESVPGMGSDI
jgi:hypothetical protein